MMTNSAAFKKNTKRRFPKSAETVLDVEKMESLLCST